LKKDMAETYHDLTCPFCSNRFIEAKPGFTRCPVCDAHFEIDDRLECIFASTEMIRLPVNGTVCSACGLVQGVETRNCLYCGMRINTAVH
jgi:hypothetical protein